MRHVHENNNFIVFTLAVVLLLLTTAVVGSTPRLQGLMLVEMFILITQVAAYLSLDFGRRWRIYVLVMLALIGAVNVASQNAPGQMLSLLTLLLILVFYLSVAYSVARRVLFPREVNTNIVVGALAIYLLMGLIWATLYLITLELFPQAFNGLEHITWSDNFSNALYYSYITMTSVGYGEITPAITLSRTLAYLQATLGAFYMAVVVASLVSARRPSA